MLNEGDKHSTLELFVTIYRPAIAQFGLIVEEKKNQKK